MPTGRLRVFHLIQTGMFSEPIKAQHLLPPLSAAPVSPIKLSTACSSPLCSIQLERPPPHTNPPTPMALFVYCCDKRGKLIRR